MERQTLPKVHAVRAKGEVGRSRRDGGLGCRMGPQTIRRQKRRSSGGGKADAGMDAGLAPKYSNT